MIRFLVLWSLFFLIEPAAGASSSFDEGYQAYQQLKYGDALRILKPLAEDGNSSAQYVLGEMYGLGLGVAEDQNEALRWFTLAANGGNIPAEETLAALAISEFLENGQVTQNKQEKIRWILSSAKRGNPESMNMLGILYSSGNGVPLTTIEAEKWFCRAIKNGHPSAARNLSLMMASTIYYLERVKEVGQPIEPPCIEEE
jgi:uncharacterized protein